MKRSVGCIAVFFLTLSVLVFSDSALFAQATSQSQAVAPVTVPRFVRFGGVAHDLNGKLLTGNVGITFALYAGQSGGAPLWLETQSVQADATGHYTVLLGSTKPDGLPSEIFANEQARWIGVQIEQQVEQPRTLLVSAPYALKAGDAETLGGLPPSAFMLAVPVASNGSLPASPMNAPGANSSSTAPPPASSNVTTNGGTVNTIPMFTTATNVQNSILTQTGTTAVTVSGKLNLPATGTATATGGKGSRPEDFIASSFNSSTAAAVPQTFQLQAEATGNNTATPAGTLNLLYGSGTAAPAETGLKISSKGILTFAAGQIFPGTGKGTITGVTAGSDLTGGGTTGTVTLNLDTTKIPLLAGSNNFTAPQDFKANVGIGATPSPAGYTPLTVGGTTNFGTWLALANTSTGGHTWNIISAGSGNAEGAGNIGITDLTGKSTIWLEGNTNTANLSATGNVGAATLVVTSTAGASIIDADGFGQNAGGPTPGLRFGGGSSGEGIASNRVIGLTKFGLDFYTNYTSRMSILQSGQVAMGTASPGAQLGVVGSSNAYPAIYSQAGGAANGSGQNGSDGIDAYGSNGDLSSPSSYGGAGITAFGGAAGNAGAGGIFTGGTSSNPYDVGDGIVANAGGPTGEFGAVAGFFGGDITVNGNVFNDAVTTRIDNPLDPANKYLIHSSVASSEMKNMYDGTITTDAGGEAVVELPEWFESVNRDFRYQLTVLGQFAQAIVAEKIADHHFIIRTDKPNVEVSWQVTGVRQDPWANAHRIRVEEAKSARERGHFIHPELYGAPEQAGIEWARYPQAMQQQKQQRLKAAQAAK
jgi:hypothetical protein